MWFAAGTPPAVGQRDALLDAARACSAGHDALAAFAGSTAVNDAVIVLRVLAERVEPAMRLLAEVWSAWRQQAWRLAAVAPRVWRT
jgi:urease accessory protein